MWRAMSYYRNSRPPKDKHVMVNKLGSLSHKIKAAMAATRATELTSRY